MKIFFDGGLRPTGMELAVVARGQAHVARDLGPGTSMEAEWLALIAALRLVHRMGGSDTVLLGDAAAVIAQARGLVRVPERHREHLRLFAALPRPPGIVRLRHVRRTQNLAGIALARPDRPALPLPVDRTGASTMP